MRWKLQNGMRESTHQSPKVKHLQATENCALPTWCGHESPAFWRDGQCSDNCARALYDRTALT